MPPCIIREMSTRKSLRNRCSPLRKRSLSRKRVSALSRCSSDSFATKSKIPSIFIGQGIGPLPLMQDPSHSSMLHTFSSGGCIHKAFHNPNVKAIVFISAHYMASSEMPRGISSSEEGRSRVLVQCESDPMLLFDYYGFPREAYEYTLPNPGSIPLAEKIVSMINNGGIFSNNDKSSEYSRPILSAKLDQRQRGFDHGVFVPMLALDVPAHLPVVTVSLANDQDTRAHIALGKALAPLREKGVLIVGSGLSFHNREAFCPTGSLKHRNVKRRALAFDEGLSNLITETTSKNIDRLEEWKNTVPWSDFCHPTAEHIMPLFVVAASALSDSGEDGEKIKEKIHKIPFDLMGIPASHFIFE